MNRVALDQQFRFHIGRGLPGYPVAEPALYPGNLGYGSFDSELVVIECRGFVSEPGFSERQCEAHVFYLLVGDDPLPHQLRAAPFKIAQVVGIIYDPPGVGIAVEDPYGCVVNVF